MSVVTEERCTTERKLNEDTLLLQFRDGRDDLVGLCFSFGRTIDRGLRLGVDRRFRRLRTSFLVRDGRLLLREGRVKSTKLLGVTLQRRVEGVDLGRSRVRNLLRIVRRGLSLGDRSAVVDAAHCLGRSLGSGSSGICRRHRAREGRGGGRSATNSLGLRSAGAGRTRGGTNLLALVLILQRRAVRVRNEVQHSVTIHIHRTVTSCRSQLATREVHGAVASLARQDVLEEPKLRGRLGRDRTAEATRETRNHIRTTDDVQRRSVAARRLPSTHLAVIVQAIVPQLGVGGLVDAGVDIGMLIVAVTTLNGAGGQNIADSVAHCVLVAIIILALHRSRESGRGNDRGREGQQQQGKLLHRELLGHRPGDGNTTVPSGCRVWETYPLLHSRHPEGLTRSLGIHSFEELHPRPVQINQ